MAGESCNIDKDDAEILKPTTTPSSSPSSASSSPPAPPPPALFLKPSGQVPPISVSAGDESPEIEAGPRLTSKPDNAHAAPASSKSVNRCLLCQKKVGLTGFRCRCGHLFCSRHRYTDTHDCSFDYKTAGREEIARSNPVVRAAKIIKI